MMQSSHWLHGNSIPKIGCHYFWSGLIALPKNTLPIILGKEDGWRTGRIQGRLHFSSRRQLQYIIIWSQILSFLSDRCKRDARNRSHRYPLKPSWCKSWVPSYKITFSQIARNKLHELSSEFINCCYSDTFQVIMQFDHDALWLLNS